MPQDRTLSPPRRTPGRAAPPSSQRPPRRLGRRLVQLYAGLVLYGISMALVVRSELGVMPWDVLHQGLARSLGWSLGTVGGVLAGGSIPDPKSLGLDALFPAFFLVLVWGELIDRAARITAVAATLIAAVLIPIAPPGIPVVAATVAVLVGRMAQR